MAVDEQALLRVEAQHALIPFAVAEHAELFEQLARQRFAFGGHGNIVRGPGKFRDFVLAPARIAAGLLLHFEQHEIVKAALVQMPGGIQSGHAAADDHDRNAQLLRRALRKAA